MMFKEKKMNSCRPKIGKSFSQEKRDKINIFSNIDLEKVNCEKLSSVLWNLTQVSELPTFRNQHDLVFLLILH